ncbi:TonB-dependent receptor, partial [Xanthomonas sp. Kuri4-2]
PGDRLALAAGDYRVHQVLAIDRPLTVQGPRRGSAVITFSRPTLFEIRPGGDLRLSALTVSGRDAPDAAGNAVIRTGPGGSAANYRLILENVQLRELHGNPGFDVIHTGKDSLADLIELLGVRAEDISGSVLAAAAETDDHGTYNAEQVRISHSRFRRIDGPAVDLYRGGTDESTFGPRLEVAHSQFERVGARAGAS